MKIWIAEIGEPLPVEKDVRLHRYGEFSKYLAGEGHEVTWWTSTFSHTPKINYFDESTDKIIDGVNIKFLYGKGYKRNVSIARINHHKNFASQFKKIAIEKIKNGKKPDIIISPIPTIAVAKVCSDICRENGIKHIIDIRDYWPDEIVNLAPKILRPVSKRILKKMYLDMEAICKNSTGMMGNSQISIDYGLSFAKRSQKKSDYVFPLGYSSRSYSDESLYEAKTWFDSLKLNKTAFRVCFFGTIGRFFDLDLVIDTASKLQSFNIDFLIAGCGDKLEYYQKKSNGLKNIRFVGWVDAKKIQVIMKNSHVGLAPYVLTTDFAMPNKIFEYFSGGLPVVSSIQKELPKILNEYNCGITYSGKCSEELKELLMELSLNPEKVNSMKIDAALLFNKKYRMEKTFSDAMSHIESL